MNVLGISGLHGSVQFQQGQFPHFSRAEHRIVQGLDAAAALVSENGVIAAAAEERFSRNKGTGDFPVGAIQYCLAAGGIRLDEVAFIAHGFDYEPFAVAFESLGDFEKHRFRTVYSRAAQLKWLAQFFPSHDLAAKLVRVPHHLAHAASAFYLSGMDRALVLVSDGMGEAASATVAIADREGIRVLREIPGRHSVGILYGLVTLHAGFEMNSDEYKMMGLAAYGNAARTYPRFMDLIVLHEDGTYAIPALYENRTPEEKERYGGTRRLLAELFGPARNAEEPISTAHMDIAAGMQQALQTVLLHTCRHFRRQTGIPRLCMAGGVALNCSANGVLQRSRIFDEIFIQPAAGDDGTSVGAALYVQRQHEPGRENRRLGLPLWGPAYDTQVINQELKRASTSDRLHTQYMSLEELAEQVAALIARGNIVGWFHGRMEFGPRALGSRSILGDPRDPTMRDRLNSRVKKREAFRPFAPAVTAEAACELFDIRPGEEHCYRHMLLATAVRAEYRLRLPAVTHIDGSARVQVVFRNEHPALWKLLTAFESVAGIPVLLNTSFNVKGQPIVCTPRQALETFETAQLDALVLGECLVTRAGH